MASTAIFFNVKVNSCLIFEWQQPVGEGLEETAHYEWYGNASFDWKYGWV